MSRNHNQRGRAQSQRNQNERYAADFRRSDFRGPSWKNQHEEEEDWDKPPNSNRTVANAMFSNQRPQDYPANSANTSKVDPSETHRSNDDEWVDHDCDGNPHDNWQDNKQGRQTPQYGNNKNARKQHYGVKTPTSARSTPNKENANNNGSGNPYRNKDHPVYERNCRDPNQWEDHGNEGALSEHTCSPGPSRISSELPSPPAGYARLICPTCYQPVFVPEKAKWIEYSRILPGDHPFDQCPPKGYRHDPNCTPWWHRQCANCGRYNHIASMCDQNILVKRCTYCRSIGHEIAECRKRKHYNQVMNIPTIHPARGNGSVPQYHATRLCKCDHPGALQPCTSQQNIENDWDANQPSESQQYVEDDWTENVNENENRPRQSTIDEDWALYQPNTYKQVQAAQANADSQSQPLKEAQLTLAAARPIPERTPPLKSCQDAVPMAPRSQMKRSRSADDLREAESNMDISPNKVRVLENIRIPGTPTEMCQDAGESATRKLPLAGTPGNCQELPPVQVEDASSSDDESVDNSYTQRSSLNLATSMDMTKQLMFDLTSDDEKTPPVPAGSRARPIEKKPNEPKILQEILLALSLENGITKDEMVNLQKIPMMQLLDTQVDAISKQMRVILQGFRKLEAKKNR